MIKESKLNKGISVIIPTYKSERFIGNILDSLVNQTIKPDLFEAIFIINGLKDSSEDIIKQYQKNYPHINLIITCSSEGVCNARNKGIELASRQYLIFMDDDDYISYNYLEEVFKHAKPSRIVLGTFLDVDDKTGEVKPSYLSKPLLELSGAVDNPYEVMADAIVITTNKLIPTANVKKHLFNPELKNGVDIAYFSLFYPVNDFEFYIVDKSRKAVYYRLWRDNSISRKALSYEFNITDRLKVIAEINKALKLAKTQTVVNFLKSLTGGQVNKINEYLRVYPDDYTRVLKDILKYDFQFFPYKYLNTDIDTLDNSDRELIISYAFCPTNTTTSNVVAKRILDEEKNIDVVCGNLNQLNKDYSLDEIVSQFIVKKTVVDCEFGIDWPSIKDFVLKAITQIKDYDKIYSRANYVHSHFLALEYKLKNPDVYWRAEFSDPLVKTFNGRSLSTKIGDKDYVSRMNRYLKDFDKINPDMEINLVCEYLTLIFADEVIFTNTNQKQVVLEEIPFDISDIVNKKTVIKPHPTLDEKYYYIKQSSYEVNHNYINFAYFGDIFSNRTFEDFIAAFMNVNSKKIKLHIFTSTKTLFEQILPDKLYENTVINENVDYLEFLNLTNKFDILMVEDSYTNKSFSINPYLPSKISDYLASTTPVWSVCEAGSVMSQVDVEYKSQLNNYASNILTLNSIMDDKLTIKKDIDVIDMEEYYRLRINTLTQRIVELISIAEDEFSKDSNYETQINNLENELNDILNSNSWKLTENFRKIRNLRK